MVENFISSQVPSSTVDITTVVDSMYLPLDATQSRTLPAESSTERPIVSIERRTSIVEPSSDTDQVVIVKNPVIPGQESIPNSPSSVLKELLPLTDWEKRDFGDHFGFAGASDRHSNSLFMPHKRISSTPKAGPLTLTFPTAFDVLGASDLSDRHFIPDSEPDFDVEFTLHDPLSYQKESQKIDPGEVILIDSTSHAEEDNQENADFQSRRAPLKPLPGPIEDEIVVYKSPMRKSPSRAAQEEVSKNDDADVESLSGDASSESDSDSDDEESDISSDDLHGEKLTRGRRKTLTKSKHVYKSLKQPLVLDPNLPDAVEYTVIPLPLDFTQLNDLHTMERLPEEIECMALSDIKEKDLRPWLVEKAEPSEEDIERNLAMIQALHYSCSWAVPDDLFMRMQLMEARELSLLESGSYSPSRKRARLTPDSEAGSLETPEASPESHPRRPIDAGFSRSSITAKLSFPLKSYRHGSEIICLGDMLRLVTTTRQTRAQTVSMTYNTLFLTGISYTNAHSSESDELSPDKLMPESEPWESFLYLTGEVCEPHPFHSGAWVTTGEVRTVDLSDISGKWYPPYPKLFRPMPVCEQELWLGQGLRKER